MTGEEGRVSRRFEDSFFSNIYLVACSILCCSVSAVIDTLSDCRYWWLLGVGIAGEWCRWCNRNIRNNVCSDARATLVHRVFCQIIEAKPPLQPSN